MVSHWQTFPRESREEGGLCSQSGVGCDASLWAVLQEKEPTAPTRRGSPHKEQLFSEEEGGEGRGGWAELTSGGGSPRRTFSSLLHTLPLLSQLLPCLLLSSTSSLSLPSPPLYYFASNCVCVGGNIKGLTLCLCVIFSARFLEGCLLLVLKHQNRGRRDSRKLAHSIRTTHTSD